MQAVLVMFRSDGERRSFSITRDVTVIGRRDDCDLRIPLHDVSRKHCRLLMEGEQLRLEDLGSSNGTYVNGQRVERDAVLQPGDSVQVGPVVFVLQQDGYPSDEELNPVVADQSAMAGADYAAAGGAVAGAAVGEAMAHDDLDPLASDNLDDLQPLPLGDDELPPLGDDAGFDPLGDSLGGTGGHAGSPPGAAEDDLGDLADLSNEAPPPAAPSGAHAPISLVSEDDSLAGLASPETGVESRQAGPPISMDDEDSIDLADQPISLADEPLDLAEGAHSADEPNPLDLDESLGMTDDDAVGGPDNLLIELDDQHHKPG